jgi:hypothetical protein
MRLISCGTWPGDSGETLDLSDRYPGRSADLGEPEFATIHQVVDGGPADAEGGCTLGWGVRQTPHSGASSWDEIIVLGQTVTVGSVDGGHAVR